MKIKNNEISLEKAIEFAKVDNLLLKRRNNDFLFSDMQINTLKRYGIDYNNYNNLDELLFDIEEILNNSYDEELDLISSQIAELRYYKDTKK